MPGRDLSGALIKAHTYQATIPAARAVIKGTADDTCKLPTAANQRILGFTIYDGVSGDVLPVHMAGGLVEAQVAEAVAVNDELVVNGTDGKLGKATTVARTQLDANLVPAAHLATPTKTALALLSVKVNAAAAAVSPIVTEARVPAANKCTPTKTALALLSVNVTSAGGGQPTGSYGVLPRGGTPASGECALDSNGDVVFNGANGVAAVTIEYLIAIPPARTGPYRILPKGSTPAAGECALDSNGKVVFNAGDAVTDVTIEYLFAPEAANVVAIAMGTATADGDIIPVLPVRSSKQS